MPELESEVVQKAGGGNAPNASPKISSRKVTTGSSCGQTSKRSRRFSSTGRDVSEYASVLSAMRSCPSREDSRDVSGAHMLTLSAHGERTQGASGRQSHHPGDEEASRRWIMRFDSAQLFDTPRCRGHKGATREAIFRTRHSAAGVALLVALTAPNRSRSEGTIAFASVSKAWRLNHDFAVDRSTMDGSRGVACFAVWVGNARA
jgi:hypothetical protein